MKIKNASVGALTNSEVLNFLQSRGATREVAATVKPSEYKVFQYLVDTAASNQTRESLSVFLEKIEKYNLAKAEVLNIINIRPTLPVSLFAMVEKYEERLGDEAAEELVELVAEVLPPPPEQLQPEEELAAELPQQQSPQLEQLQPNMEGLAMW